MSTAKQRERDEAIARLRKILEPGDTVWTVLRHVSRSGMSRAIDAYAIHSDEPRWLSRWVATAIGASFSEKYEAVTVGGYGMDMGFHLVYSLSRALWPDGFDCLGPFAYLADSEVIPTQYPHIGMFEDEGQRTEIHLPHAPDTDGFLPRYLFWRHNCPSNDHSNARYPDAAPTHHKDGDALRHRWL